MSGRKVINFTISVSVSTLFSIGILVVVFGGIGFLNPSNVIFLQGDSRAHYVSQLFYLSDNWHFPLGANPNYGEDLSSYISVNGPWPFLLVFFQKLFRVSPELQLYGLLMWINLTIHHQIARQILRRLGLNWISQHIFGLFFFTPFLIFRHELHPLSVAIQWPILWAISLLLKYRIEGRVSTVQIFLLTFLSYSVFLNLWFIVVCALLFQITQFRTNDGVAKSLARCVSKVVSPILLSTFLAALLMDGLFFIGNQEGSNNSQRFRTEGWGTYNFNPVSFINPDTGIRDFWYFKPEVGNAEGWSYNMSSTGVSFGMTYGSYEGYTYLGIGVIVLITLSWVFASRNIKKFFKLQLTKLSLVYAVSLFVYAIAPLRLTFGGLDIRISTSYFQSLIGPLVPFRSSGRMMLLFGYILIVASIYFVTKAFSIYKASLLLCSCLVIQILDLSYPLMKRFDYSTSLLSNSVDWRQEVPPEVSNMAAGKDSLRIFPVENRTEGYDQLSWWAWNLKLSTNSVYSARPDLDLIAKLNVREKSNICSGNISSFAVYAIQKSEYGTGELTGCDLSLYNSTETEKWLFIVKE